MKKLLAITLAILSVSAYAQQNHVPNGDFETYTSCPSSLSQTNRCTGWGPYTNGTSDYFNICGFPSIPSNTFGYQYAASGNGYVGGYNNVNSGNSSYKEYVTRSIIPLQVGQTYEVSLSASLSNNLGSIAVDDIGVYFFINAPTFVSTIARVAVTPQVDYSGSGAFSDTANWMRLSKTFVADSAYDKIVIGGFKDPSVVVKDTVSSGTTSYYYYDSIVIRLAKRIGITFTDSTLCAGDTISVPYYVNNTSSFFQSNNVFTLQLSNASGSFASPVNIGTKATNAAGVITGVIPTNTTTGGGYRIRMISSNGADTTIDNNIDIGIGAGKPVKPVANNNSPVCNNDTLRFTASTTTSGVSYRWSGPAAFATAVQNPSIPNPVPANGGDYIVTAYIYGCEAKDTTTATVYAGNGPTGTTATANGPVCADDTLKLYGTANGSSNTYSWTGPNSFTSNVQNPQLPAVTTAAAGDYILYASNGNCVSRDTVTVQVKPRPANFTSSSNSPVCTGTAINFSASTSSTGVTYAWSGPNGFNSTSATPFIGGSSSVHTGDYYVTATLSGCPLTDTLPVTVKPLPNKPVAGSNSAICAGETLNLTSVSSTSNVTYSWTGPGSYTSTTQNPSISNTTTAMSGDYIVSAILSGCIRKDTATVEVKPVPTATTASNSGPECAGDTLYINIGTSTTGVTYSWAGPNSFSASTQNTYIANSTTAASGWYIATVDLNGCSFQDSTLATVNAIPATPTASYSSPLCVGETLQLNASNVSGATYSWTGKNNFNANTQNPTRSSMQFGDTGTYSVTATVNGCISPAGSTVVNMNPVPFVVIFATPGDSICVGDPASFTALPNNHGGTPTYKWYINSIPQGATGTTFISSSLSNGDIVRVDMTENNKCNRAYVDASNEIEMKVLPWLAPSVTITANPNRKLAVDEYVTFTATVVNGGKAPLFQWKRNGQDVQGATSAQWSANTLNDNDKITVEIVSNYRCPQPPTAVSNDIVVNVATGIGDVAAGNGKLNVYPNPAKDYVIFELVDVEMAGKLSVEILNVLGQEAGSVELNNKGIARWQTGALPSGVYVYRLKSGDEVMTAGRVVLTK